MSRIGKKSITVPSKVTVKLERQKISVNGPKGNLSRILPSVICCTFDEKDNQLFGVFDGHGSDLTALFIST